MVTDEDHIIKSSQICMFYRWLPLNSEKRKRCIDSEIFKVLTSLILGISSLVRPEDLISSEPSDLAATVT